jgi:arylsulfatase A-like enzyme
LMRYPALIKPGTLRDEMVLNIDLAPTFLSLAAVNVPAEMQGASWVPLLKGHSHSWRQAFLYEYFFEPGLPATPAMVALRTPSAKLITYPGHSAWTELFDLKRDPYEINNEATAAGFQKLRSSLETRLQQQLRRYGGPKLN